MKNENYAYYKVNFQNPLSSSIDDDEWEDLEEDTHQDEDEDDTEDWDDEDWDDEDEWDDYEDEDEDSDEEEDYDREIELSDQFDDECSRILDDLEDKAHKNKKFKSKMKDLCSID